MTSLTDSALHLSEYQVLGVKQEEHDLHFQIDAPHPIACEECGVEGEFLRFGKRDVAYWDLPIHGKRVTLWVVRRQGYSFEVMRARMLYTTKHKKKSLQTKESPFLGMATMAYSKSLPPVEKN